MVPRTARERQWIHRIAGTFGLMRTNVHIADVRLGYTPCLRRCARNPESDGLPASSGFERKCHARPLLAPLDILDAGALVFADRGISANIDFLSADVLFGLADFHRAMVVVTSRFGRTRQS